MTTTNKTPRANVRKARANANKPAQSAPVPALSFIVTALARPTSGARLAAHTRAFMELSGMLDGKPVPKAIAIKAIGPTAIKYHTGQGNIAHTEAGLSLTEFGAAYFAARRAADPEMVKGYRQIMTTGAMVDSLGVKVAAAVAPIGDK